MASSKSHKQPWLRIIIFHTAAAQPIEQHSTVTFNIWCLWSGEGIGVLNYVCWVNVFLLHQHQLAPVLHRQQQKPLHYLQKHPRVANVRKWYTALMHRQTSPHLPPDRILYVGHITHICWPTLGCRLVSCSNVMASGSGTACATIVGPKILAKLVTSILVFGLWATLYLKKKIKVASPLHLPHSSPTNMHFRLQKKKDFLLTSSHKRQLEKDQWQYPPLPRLSVHLNIPLQVKHEKR